MKYVSPHSFLLEISPERSFLENWGQFKAIKKLYIPVSLGTECAADPNNTLEVLEFIDIASASFTTDMRVGLVYTDPGLSTSNSLLAEIDTVLALKRFFKNKSIQGLTFNPPMQNDHKKLAFTAYRSILPRVIGYLSVTSNAKTPTTLAKHSETYRKQNRVYEALHASALAREEGAKLDSCFFVELDALFSLGMLSEAQQLMQWYPGNDSRIELFKIRLRSLSGHAVESMTRLVPLLSQEANAALCWLEQGRALLMQNKAKDAVAAFDKSLQYEESCDALLGKGIALRAMHYGQLNKQGLLSALKEFEAVINYNGTYKPEALHHAGTIHSALQQWDEAVECYSHTLELGPSPVSKQNLALALHALGDIEAATEAYEYLAVFYPTYAQNIEKYFEADEILFTPAGSEDSSDTFVTQKRLAAKDLEALAQDARARLKTRRITMKNDLLDFRRVDDYVNYHAPAGVFLDSSHLFRLSEREYKSAIFDIAIHLGQLLVDEKLAQWQIEADFTPMQVGLIIAGEQTQMPISMFANVARRVQAGGSDNAMVSLDALVNLLPGYHHIAMHYSNPFMALPADEERLEEFETRAQRAKALLEQFDFRLDGSLNDVRELEFAIASIWSETGGLSELEQSGSMSYELVDDIGFYLGSLFENLAGGEWYDHNDLNGISLQSMIIKNIHPILEIRKRLEIGPDVSEMTSLLVFEPPLVCAYLCAQMQENVIDSREQLLQLIAENLPSILDDDPSGKSINRMADMITAFAAKVSQ